MKPAGPADRSDDEVRLYFVSHPEVAKPRLIWAKSKARAIEHVTRPYEAAVATQRQIVAALRDGVEEETA